MLKPPKRKVPDRNRNTILSESRKVGSHLLKKPQTRAEYARYATLLVGLISPVLGWGIGDLLLYLVGVHIVQQVIWLSRWFRSDMDIASKVFRGLAHLIFLLVFPGAVGLLALHLVGDSNPVVAGLLDGRFRLPQWLFVGGWIVGLLLQVIPESPRQDENWIDYRENQWLANLALFGVIAAGALLSTQVSTWLSLPCLALLKYGVDVLQDYENLRLRQM